MTIVLNTSGRTVGVVVDSVADVIASGRDQIRSAPAFNRTLDTGYITGVGIVPEGGQDRMLILVDIDELIFKAHVGLTH